MAKRPYLVVYDGRSRMIEAGSLARAQRHVVKGELARHEDAIRKKLGDRRCANAVDVIEFYRGGGTIEQEGEYPSDGGLLGKLTPGDGGEATGG